MILTDTYDTSYTRFSPSPPVLWQLGIELCKEATKLCPEWEKAHFLLGRFYDGLLRISLVNADRKEVVCLGAVPGHKSEFGKKQVGEAERRTKKLDAYLGGHGICSIHHVLRYYGHSLRRGMRNAPLVLPRVLALWLDFAELDAGSSGGGASTKQPSTTKRTPQQVHDQIAELMRSLPLHQWIPATAQVRCAGSEPRT